MDQVPITRTIVADGTENSPGYSTMDEVFGRFEEIFKQYEESKQYGEWKEVKIFFDSKMLKVDDTTDIESIIEEINNVSSKMFTFGYLYESQQKVVKQLEDEYDKWFAEKYIIVDTTEVEIKEGLAVKYIKRTESAKEKLIMAAYSTEYSEFQTNLRDEKYKLGIVNRVVKSLESYSYKLHSILNYRQMTVQRGIG